MYNRRNKLLLNLAQKRTQTDIYNSEDLSNLIDNINAKETDEDKLTNSSETLQHCPQHIEPRPELIKNTSDAEFSIDSTNLELFGDLTLKNIFEDLTGEITMDTTDFEGKTVEDNTPGAMAIQSATPVPSEYISFASSPRNRLSINENPKEFFDQVCSKLIDYSDNDFIASSPASPSSLMPLSTDASSSAADGSSECSSPSSTTKRRRRKFDIDTTKKKRQCKKDNWLDTKRKLLVNLGKNHLSRKGKEQQGKTLKPACLNCKFKCHTKISNETRQDIFDLFWGLGDHVKQWQFIGKHTKRFTKKRITTENNSNRNFSVHYFLPIVSIDNVIKVCKTMFKNTLNVSNQFIQSGMEKYNVSTGVCEKDKRGDHHNKKKLLTDAVIKSVCDHVKSFCPIESHYTRKDSNKMYLDGDLSFVKMFKMYQDWTADNNINDKVSSLRQYRDVVNSNMNIGFYVPKKDQCDVCTAHKNKLNTPEEPDSDFSKHIQNKNIARSLKSQDKKLAQCELTKVSAATFDFQKILCAPHGETSSFYYKRKLSIFNFTVFDMGTKRGICYMWDETTAKRGSNEVASCLYNYISQIAEKGIKDIRLWSDNCGGQNRNRSVFSMYLYAAQKLNVSLCHRFLEKGHTQQEGDSVHALIERSSKNKTIYTPQEWYTCARWCKVTGEPYEVIEVSTEDIFDFKSHLKQYLWLKNSNNEKVRWSQVREIKVDPSEPYVIYYRYDLNEDQSMSIECFRRANTRTRQNNVVALEKAYSSIQPITSSKYNDLNFLCQQNLIPPRYHTFFKNLKHTSTEKTVSDDEE